MTSKLNLKLALLGIVCLTMISCAQQAVYDSSPKTYIPNLPSNITNAGSFVAMPKGPYSAKKLVPKLVESDRRNARAVKSCISNHKKLQLLYNGKGGL